MANFSGQCQGSLISGKTHHKVFSDLEEAIRVAKVLNCPYLMLLTDQLGEGGIVENSYPELTMEEKYHNTVTSLKKAIGFVGFEYSPALDSYESLIKIKQLWNAVFPGFFD